MLKRQFLKVAALAVVTLLADEAMAAEAGPYVPTPEGQVAIHYKRPAGDYEGWGVHLWKSPSVGLTGWSSPMRPTGMDDFGAYFHIPFVDFGSTGEVNYILHKGDSKDQNGKDKMFDGKAHKEVWIVQGNANIFTSKEEALAAVK